MKHLVTRSDSFRYGKEGFEICPSEAEIPADNIIPDNISLYSEVDYITEQSPLEASDISSSSAKQPDNIRNDAESSDNALDLEEELSQFSTILANFERRTSS